MLRISKLRVPTLEVCPESGYQNLGLRTKFWMWSTATKCDALGTELRTVAAQRLCQRTLGQRTAHCAELALYVCGEKRSLEERWWMMRSAPGTLTALAGSWSRCEINFRVHIIELVQRVQIPKTFRRAKYRTRSEQKSALVRVGRALEGNTQSATRYWSV